MTRTSDCEGCYWNAPDTGCNHGTAWWKQSDGDVIIKCKHRKESKDVPTYTDNQGTLALNTDGQGKIVVSIGDERTAITRDQAYTMSRWLVRMANRHSSEEVEL